MLAGTHALAQYPTKALRLIVPFPHGGTSDVFARIIRPSLSEGLGRPVSVENRSGAGGNIGAALVAKSPPDGHTLLVVNVAHAFNATLYSKASYHLARDFAPVSLLAFSANVLVVHPSVPARTVRDLITLARGRPGQLDFASAGSGSSAHLAAVLFIHSAGVQLKHIPYKGGGPSMIGLAVGEASLGFPPLPTAMQHVKAGKLRALAVTSAHRCSSIPDLPTVSEAGVTGYQATTWFGLLVPAGTSHEVVLRLHGESIKAVKRQDVKDRLYAADLEPIGTTPEQFGMHIRTEIAKWGQVVKMSGARAD